MTDAVHQVPAFKDASYQALGSNVRRHAAWKTVQDKKTQSTGRLGKKGLAIQLAGGGLHLK